MWDAYRHGAALTWLVRCWGGAFLIRKAPAQHGAISAGILLDSIRDVTYFGDSTLCLDCFLNVERSLTSFFRSRSPATCEKGQVLTGGNNGRH